MATQQKASTSFIQRKFKIGYNRAARIIDELEERGIVGPDMGGTKGREVKIDKYQYNEWKNRRDDYDDIEENEQDNNESFLPPWEIDTEENE